MSGSLIDVLASRGNAALVTNLEKIRKEAAPLLSQIEQIFPDYTPHDINHKDRVIDRLQLLIPESLEKTLNEYELFFLLAATYVHDIGMNDLEGLESYIPSSTLKGSERTDYIRKYHHLRTEEFVVKFFHKLKIDDEFQARIIARIARGHREDDIHDKKLFDNEDGYSGKPINVPLLASLLRIADELDLAFDRTPMTIYEHVPPVDPISKDEWQRHIKTSVPILSPEDLLLVKCKAYCKSVKIHRSLRKVEDKVNKELDELPDHLHQHGECRRDLPRKFRIEITPEGTYKPYDFKFSLKEKHITKLLMGEKLYSDKYESIRELLKNSLDACRRKKDLIGTGYVPQIKFEHSKDMDKLIVDDNGVGMNEDTIERYFTKIGESFYRSDEFRNEHHSFSPVSELGIGILSCFMIAQRIIIDTKTDKDEALRIEIDDVSDYFYVEASKRTTSGTSITLILKESVKNELKLANLIQYYARHIEFPITVVHPDGSIITISDLGYQPKLQPFFDPITSRRRRMDQKLATFHIIKIHDEQAEGTVALIGKKKHGRFTPINSYEVDTWQSSTRVAPRHYLSTNGIFVGNIKLIESWINGDLFYIDINLKNNPLELNAARNGLITSDDKYRAFTTRLSKIIVQNLEPLLALYDKDKKRSSIRLKNTFIENYLPDNLDLTSLLRSNRNRTSHPYDSIYLDLARKHYHFRCMFALGKVEYLSHDELVRYNKIVKTDVSSGLLEEIPDSYYEYFAANCKKLKDKTVYILSDNDTISTLLIDAPTQDIYYFVAGKKSKALDHVLAPNTWQLVNYTNYNTPLLIDVSPVRNTRSNNELYDTFALNQKNRFIDFIIREKNQIRKAKMQMAVEGFFLFLGESIWSSHSPAIKKQKELLQNFVKVGLIKKNKINSLLLKDSDFPY